MSNSGIDHVTSAAITEAANWYRQNCNDCPRPVLTTIRSRFGLSIVDAIEALREARRGGADEAAS